MTPTLEQVREKTREVLSRPEFESKTSESFRSFAELVERFFHQVGLWAAAHPLLARALFGVLVLALFVVIAHMVYLLLSNQQSVGMSNAQPKHVRSEVLEGAGADLSSALANARAALEQQDLPRAIWIAHRLLLGLLDAQEIIRFEGWKTNARYQLEAPASHDSSELLLALNGIYDRVIYGQHGVAREEVASLLDQVQKAWDGHTHAR